ncbi:hypothetical protein D3C78_1249050 [compost metagenome]
MFLAYAAGSDSFVRTFGVWSICCAVDDSETADVYSVHGNEAIVESACCAGYGNGHKSCSGRNAICVTISRSLDQRQGHGSALCWDGHPWG